MNSEEPKRRNRLDLMTAAEKIIVDAIQEVEKAGCDVRLTRAVILLGQAREAVSDFVDGTETADLFSQYIRERYREADQWVRKFMNADTQDEIYELKYWYGKRMAIEVLASNYAFSNNLPNPLDTINQ